MVSRENQPVTGRNEEAQEDHQHVAGYNCGNPAHADGRNLNDKQKSANDNYSKLNYSDQLNYSDSYHYSYYQNLINQENLYNGSEYSGDTFSTVFDYDQDGYQANELDGRVVGGVESRENEYPWQVFLQTCYCDSSVDCGSSSNICANCGGSIISPNWILTAAHCVDLDLYNGNGVFMNNPTYAVAGTNDKTDVKCTSYYDTSGILRTICENVLWYEKVIYHEDWDDSGNELTFGVDIAVINYSPSDPNFVFNSNNVVPICLPSADLCLEGGSRDGISQGDYLDVSGWGKTDSSNPSTTNLLKDAKLMLVDNTECNSYWHWVPKSVVCAGHEFGTGTCQGDSGGALTWENKLDTVFYQYGIVSFGSASGCGLAHIPAGYTRVTSFLDWIYGKTRVKGVDNSNSVSYGSTTCSDPVMDSVMTSDNKDLLLEEILFQNGFGVARKRRKRSVDDGTENDTRNMPKTYERAPNTIRKMSKTTTNQFNSRKKRQALDMVDAITRIGCWCPKLIGETAFQGNTVDGYDELCKELSACEYRAYRCSSGRCNDFDISTPRTYKYNYDSGDNSFVCKSDLSCDQDICECELNWATSVMELILRDNGEVLSEFLDVDAGECGNGNFFGDFEVTTQNLPGATEDWEVVTEGEQVVTQSDPEGNDGTASGSNDDGTGFDDTSETITQQVTTARPGIVTMANTGPTSQTTTTASVYVNPVSFTC